MTDQSQGPDVLLSDENFDGQNDSEEFVDDFDDAWHAELEDALLEGFVDHSIIRNICKCRILPLNHRLEVWKICLNIASRGNALSSWDGKLDLPEQSSIHAACEKAVADIGLEHHEQAVSDLESVITFYCKSRAVKYDDERAWTDLLLPIVDLPELVRGDLYNCFYAILPRYIPREALPDAPYNLLRLLLLYHDPELCSFLDSHKVTIQAFVKPWFRTLFAGKCKLGVTQALWDVYLQRADPFFVFFLALVILVNAKEQMISTMVNKEKAEIAKALTDLPKSLETVDVEDFCQLAAYFSDKTPQSVRKSYQDALFSGPVSLSISRETKKVEEELAQSLCLQVAVSDVLLSAQPAFSLEEEESESSQVRFFLVDCRSPDLYNAGHLNTAFHLDATLMLCEPKEFATAVEALFKAQEQAIQAGSAAGGEHLCLIGSGVDEEDQYMYMVIAHLLKNHRSFVSTVRGGFRAILTYLSDVNINLSEWITGTSSPKQLLNSLKSDIGKPSAVKDDTVDTKTSESRIMESFMKSFKTTLKTKSQNIKDKVTKFMENPDEESMTHLGAKYNGKPYRGTQPVFSIGDEDEHNVEDKPTHVSNKAPLEMDSDVDEDELITLDKWMKERGIKELFSCSMVSKGRHHRAHLVIDGDDMVCLRQYEERKKSRIVSRRALSDISKITSKRTCPELISFRFSVAAGEEASNDTSNFVEEIDRYLIPEAGPATKYIKQQVMRVLNLGPATSS